MIPLKSALTTALIDFAWQGVLVACLLWITLFILRNRSANARYLASCIALFAMLALPIITSCTAFHEVLHPTVAAAPISLALASPDPPQQPPQQPLASWLLRIQLWVVPAWSLGVLLFSCRLVFACCQLSTFKRRGAPAPKAVRDIVDNLATRMGLARTVRVLLSTVADAPSVAGILRPVLLLPVSSITGLTLPQLEAVLAHELAHLRRYDPLVNAMQILIETLLFYHPAVWWTSARIRHERELCCDDLALRYCGDALCYARALTALEKLRVMPGALAIGSTGGSLLYRVRRIIGERPGEYSPSKFLGFLATALAIAGLAINAGSRIQAQDAPAASSTIYQSSIYQSPGVKVDTGGAVVVEPIRYPRSAVERAIQGTVVVQLDVDASGEVTDARVLSGPPELRKSALQPLLTWRFKSNGSASTRQISVEFQVPTLAELDTAGASSLDAEAKRRAELDARRSAELQEQAEQLKRAAEDVRNQVNLQQQVQLSSDAARFEQQLSRELSPGLMTGRVLARIDVEGLSEQQRDQLINQLPVKIGDTLSHDAIEGIRPAIRAIDRRLRFELVPLDNNQACLKIAAPYFASLGFAKLGEAQGDQLADLNRQIAGAQAQLDMLRGKLSERHPDMLAMTAHLNELMQRSEELQMRTHLPDKQIVEQIAKQIAELDQQLRELRLSLETHPEAASSAQIQALIQELNAQRDQLKLTLQPLEGPTAEAPAK